MTCFQSRRNFISRMCETYLHRVYFRDAAEDHILRWWQQGARYDEATAVSP